MVLWPFPARARESRREGACALLTPTCLPCPTHAHRDPIPRQGYVRDERTRLYFQIVQPALEAPAPPTTSTTATATRAAGDDIPLTDVILAHLYHFGYVETAVALQNSQDVSAGVAATPSRAPAPAPAEGPFDQHKKKHVRALILQGYVEGMGCVCGCGW